MQHDGLVTRTLLALDSASLYYRAYFGVPESAFVAPDGTPVNAVRGFLDMISRLIIDRKAAAVACAWDNDWRPQFRVDAVPSYKTHRVDIEVDGAADVEETPDTLSPQITVIREVLTAAGIPPIGADGYEADDVLGTLAHSITSLPFDALDVVTGDRDLFQLVNDAANIRVLYTARGVSKYDEVNEAFVSEKYGIPGRSYAAFAALRGDASDGLPGVPGIGEKTAAGIVNRFPTLAAIKSAVDDPAAELAAPVRAKLTAARDYLHVIDPVVVVAADCNLDLSTLLSPPHIDAARLDDLAATYGLGSSISRLRDALGRLAL